MKDHLINALEFLMRYAPGECPFDKIVNACRTYIKFDRGVFFEHSEENEDILITSCFCGGNGNLRPLKFTVEKNDGIKDLPHDIVSNILLLPGYGLYLSFSIGYKNSYLFLVRSSYTFTEEDKDFLNSFYPFMIEFLKKETAIQMLHNQTAFFHISSDYLCTINSQGLISNANTAFDECIRKKENEPVGHIDNIFSYIHPDDLSKVKENMLKKSAKFECRIRQQYGRWVWIEWFFNMFNHFPPLYHCSGRDITIMKKREREARKNALHDSLTGLPNRNMLPDIFINAHGRFKRANIVFGVLFIDLDDFKIINDKKGHDIGDLVLIEVARRLKQSVRKEDYVIRLGGDEFVVLLDNVKGENGALESANRIMESLKEPFEIEDAVFSLGASIGIALYPTYNEDPAEIIKFADEAMYIAKNAGKNKIQMYREKNINKKNKK